MANLMNRARDNFLGNNNNQHMHDEGVVMPDVDNSMDDGDMDDPMVLSTPGRTLNATMSDQALNTLNELRRNNLLCDAVISVSDDSFNVHRAIMSASSSYFRAQFTGFNSTSSPEKSDENRSVYIPGMSGAIMEQLIQYAYLRKCTINADNVHELLISADYVGMMGLVTQCKQQLATMLTPENCVSIMGFAKFRFLDDLYAKARNYLLRYFIEVAAKNKDILEIGLKDFYDIISDDELNTREEDHVWKLCIKWIDRDPENRKQYVAQLMQGVRLGLMTPKCFMEEVKEHPYVLQCDDAKPLIVETFKFMYDLDIMNPSSGELTTPPLAMPRLPHEVIFAIGGWSGGTSKGCIETYDTRADRWVNIPAEDPAGPRAYHGTAVIGYKIYSIGGYDGVEYFNTCRVFDAVRKNWKEIAPMHCRRCYVSVAELNGLIYAIGGYDGHNRLNTVERYNPKTNQWTVITSMNMQRSDASACTLRGKIYTTGGFNGQECLDSAESYDPATNVWTRIPNMNHRRSGVSCVAFRGQLYVIGGFNGTARLSTGERYDPDAQSWSFIREMNHSRSNFGLEIIDDMIFAIGGFNGVSTISHTECYVAETDEWMEATDMNVVRSALTANNVAGLPNKRDYIHKERDRLMEERRQRLLASAMARDAETISVSNASVETQDAAMDDYDSPNEDDDADDEVDAAAALAPVIEDRHEDQHPDPNRRFRVQLRAQRFGSQHEIRRRA
ncbi:kelch-like protein 10 isoform X2 [Rhagoletis pomonella]|uniref:kelch-like protein 10 isoform X2 n=1 Tax=Rhagoletis pomonella TaxID=28610 RepID=UPI00177B03B6|nr:kelch-like protein 10 isoform X2 [Rhagoletis pomonella]